MIFKSSFILLLLLSCAQEDIIDISGPKQEALNLAELSVSGMLLDSNSYLDSAKVCFDLDGDSKCGADEPQTISVEGAFTISYSKLNSSFFLIAEIDVANSSKTNSQETIKTNYVLRSSLEKCTSDTWAGADEENTQCTVNITPFTNHFVLSRIDAPDKSYEELVEENRQFFEEYVDLSDIYIDYLAGGLGLAQGSSDLYEVLAGVLLHVAIKSVEQDTPMETGGELTKLDLKKVAKVAIISITHALQTISQEDGDVSELVSSLSFLNEIIKVVENAVKIDRNSTYSKLKTSISSKTDRLFIGKASVFKELDEEPTQIEPELVETVEEVVVADPELIEVEEEVGLPPLSPLNRPSISLITQIAEGESTLFTRNTSVRIRINSFQDFVDYSNSAGDIGYQSSLVVNFYTDASCTTSLSASPVSDELGVFDINFTTNSTLIIYGQVSFADQVSPCSQGLSNVIVSYDLDNPEYICDSIHTYNSPVGGGDLGDPRIICTVDEFKNIRQDLTLSYLLGADIDLSVPVEVDENNYDAGGWIPFGVFSGVLDGNGHKIVNLKINNPGSSKQGLFSELGSEDVPKYGTIKNLVLGEPDPKQKACNPDVSDSNNDYLCA